MRLGGNLSGLNRGGGGGGGGGGREGGNSSRNHLTGKTGHNC